MIEWHWGTTAVNQQAALLTDTLELLLSGGATKSPLTASYNLALSEATELLIANAYLTGWNPPVPRLAKECQSISFIIGKDFGITRKEACRKVLSWLPAQFHDDFRVASKIDGFHPKLIAWRTTDGKHFLIVGSSNLTDAAFSTNCEANVRARITRKDFRRIEKWFRLIQKGTQPVTEKWLNSYKEARIRRGKRRVKLPVPFTLASGRDVEKLIANRRQQIKSFAKIQAKLLNQMRQCASGSLSNNDFYTKMNAHWSMFATRFQGKGFEIKCKGANWQQACISLLAVIDAAPPKSGSHLDPIVEGEIDRLARSKKRNPVRGAWLSEMLCHWFPKLYPVDNKPVKDWMKANGYRPPRGASEGEIYIDRAKRLRQTLKYNTANSAIDLAEMDTTIWHES